MKIRRQRTRARPGRVRIGMLLLVFVTVVINYMDRANLALVGPAIAQEFHLSSIQLGLIFSAFGWAYAIGQLPGGWLVDRIGPRVLYAALLVLWSVGTCAQGLLRGFAGLFCLRLGADVATARKTPMICGVCLSMSIVGANYVLSQTLVLLCETWSGSGSPESLPPDGAAGPQADCPKKNVNCSIYPWSPAAKLGSPMRYRSLLFCVALARPAFAGPPANPPYPPSPVIRELRWAPVAQIIRRGVAPDGSDCWPITWADDGDLYTAYGDGFGFEPFVPKKVSLGIAKVSGMPPDFQGVNLRSPTNESFGNGKVGRKASGMLMVDGVLYMLARNLGNSQVASSRDHGATWTWADWKFTTSFGCPTFLNFGKNYAGARDRFIYVYSPDENDAYGAADRMVLARVPQDRILEQGAYEFFAGPTASGDATWTKDIAQRAAVFSHPGHCYRGGIAYDPALHRYLWCQILPESTNAGGPRFQGGFGVYDAPEPWGPWTTVYYSPVWDVGPGESSNFPTKWMAADGRSAWLVFSGNDNFSVRHAEFVLNDGPPSP